MAKANRRKARGRTIKGRTLREREVRARALKAVEALRAARKRAKTRQQALGVVLEGAKARHGIRGRPFAEMPEQEAIKYLDKRLLPSTAEKRRTETKLIQRKKRGEQVSIRKEKAIRRLFGSGKFGVIMIKPEMVASSGAIRDFLRKNGFQIVFRKLFVFGTEEIVRLYSHTLSDREKYGKFTTQILSLLNAPSQVVVFRHQPVAAYRRLAQRHNIKASVPSNATPQDAFAAVFKDFLRQRFTAREFQTKEFEKGTASLSTKAIDALGLFEYAAGQRMNPLVMMNGVHVPVASELPLDARTLLTLTELQALEKKIRK